MTIDALPSFMVREEVFIVELDPTNHNLVCNQRQLIVTVAGVWNAFTYA